MRFILFLSILFISSYSLEDHPPETFLHFTEYCKYFKYPVETHKIKTNDGYILTFFRYLNKK